MSEEMNGVFHDKKLMVAGAIVIVVALGIFYAGAKYEKNKLSRLGLLKNGTDQTVAPKKQKKAPSIAVAPQKLADQEYAKSAYLISGETLSSDAKLALTGFTMSQEKNADGTTTITLKAQKEEYHDQVYTLKPGEQLYFIEKFLRDDENNEEKNINDDTAVIVDAAGMIVEAPRDFSK